MENVTVSAPGKLMLYGEHAVVYGKPCIATAVGQRLKATISKTNDGTLTLDAPSVDIAGYTQSIDALGNTDAPKGARFVEFAVKNFNDAHKISTGVHVETSSEFSATFGFGSSSASAVCTIKALSELFEVDLSNEEIFHLAYKTVLDVQGKGSGFDVAAGVYGGTIEYIIGGEKLEPVDIDSLPLVIGYTGEKADTVTLINEVKELADKYPQHIDTIYQQISTLVGQARKALDSKDWVTAGELMNINQGYLECLGVSSSKLAAMIHAARNAGAYGAKLSGAGRGDCMVALVNPENREKVQKSIEEVGGEVVEIPAHTEGVRVE